jgi:hypothetical protein
MKKRVVYLYAILFIGIAFLTSCNSCQQKKGKIEFVELSSNEIDTTLFDKYDAKFETTDSKNFLGIGKGATWRLWKNLHKACMEAQWFRDPFYFGVSSTVNLGAIVDKDYGLKRLMDGTNGFSETDLNRIINKGQFATCGFSQELTMSLNTFLQTEFYFTNSGQSDLNAELKLAISHNKSTNVKIDSWRINNIQEENLMDVLNEKSSFETQKKNFLKTLEKEDYKILVRVIEVKGFSSLITLENEMSAGLEAKLRKGLIAGMGNTGFTAEFNFKDKKTIEVKSGGNFFVFGQFKKAKKVIE